MYSFCKVFSPVRAALPRDNLLVFQNIFLSYFKTSYNNYPGEKNPPDKKLLCVFEFQETSETHKFLVDSFILFPLTKPGYYYIVQLALCAAHMDSVYIYLLPPPNETDA